MRPLSLVPLAVLLACAAEPPAPTDRPAANAVHTTPAAADTLDVQGWLDEVRALEAEAAALDHDTLVARSRRLADRLADRLGAAVDWRRACDTYHDPDTGEAVYDPTDPAQDQGIGRGLMTTAVLGADEAAVSVLCHFGAYQGSWALLHVEGDRVALVRAPALDEAYRPTAFETATFGEPLFEPEGHVFTTFVRSRGAGDCGALTRYRLGAGGAAEILEVRALACGDEISEDLDLDPTTWPVVYPR